MVPKSWTISIPKFLHLIVLCDVLIRSLSWYFDNWMAKKNIYICWHIWNIKKHLKNAWITDQCLQWILCPDSLLLHTLTGSQHVHSPLLRSLDYYGALFSSRGLQRAGMESSEACPSLQGPSQPNHVLPSDRQMYPLCLPRVWGGWKGNRLTKVPLLDDRVTTALHCG